MWSLILSALVFNFTFAGEPQLKSVYAVCDCQVYNQEGALISPQAFLGSPVPVVTPYFQVKGHTSSLSPYEVKNCKEDSSGELPMGCAIAAVKAKANAAYKCGKIARSYNPELIDGFKNGELVQGSCTLTLVNDNKSRSFFEMLGY